MEHHVKKKPNPTDVYIGQRIRAGRLARGMSQEKLGDAIDLTFQQVQKYEKGSNRVGGSRLAQIAAALHTTPAWFFEGAPTTFEKGAALPVADATPLSPEVNTFLTMPGGLDLARAFVTIRNKTLRARLVGLACEIADGGANG